MVSKDVNAAPKAKETYQKTRDESAGDKLMREAMQQWGVGGWGGVKSARDLKNK